MESLLIAVKIGGGGGWWRWLICGVEEEQKTGEQDLVILTQTLLALALEEEGAGGVQEQNLPGSW